MKELVVKTLSIIATEKKEARTINFDRHLTILTGDNPEGDTINRTGKSLVLKSIYYSMGANLNQYTVNWGDLDICTIISFTYDNIEYELFRYKDYFILNSGFRVDIFRSISELREYYVNFFDFNIKLKIKDTDTTTIFAFPGAIFMPFYIDQDRGWSGPWESFQDVFGGKWKNEILLYHLGVRTPKYYDLLEEKVEIDNEQKEFKNQLSLLESILKNHILKYNEYLDINIDLSKFKDEIIDLTSEVSRQKEKKEKIRQKIIELVGDIENIDNLYSIAEKNYYEIKKDIDYIEKNVSSDYIRCPTCGAMHSNDIYNKFYMFTELHECEEVMQSYFSDRKRIEEDIEKLSDNIAESEDYIQKIDTILNKKRDELSFRDIIVSEGTKSIISDLRTDILKIEDKIDKNEEREKAISKELRDITKKSAEVINEYLEELRFNLLCLDVNDISQKELHKFYSSLKSGGNDRPCAILAQVFAIYFIASKYSHTVISPIVLDAIFQQEPAKKKIDKIWDFIFEHQPNSSQLILSTTELHGRSLKNGGKIIRLLEERSLLNKDEYEEISRKYEWYKELLLRR